ncbi:MAG: hypothetical protein EHM20_00430 [Alphaproteobacteria bacterium]|nr:MAG: hypothetical protein EHM20_00430 [Alphaproteobacteria bacterium]
MSENKVLVDNWTLELAASVLAGASPLHYPHKEERRLGSKDSLRNERAQALLHFLDLIIMYDTLVVDAEREFAWTRFEGMKSISLMASRVRLSERAKAKIRSTFLNVPTENEAPEIAEGALYYLGLANLLGLDYWAAPKRVEFLSERLSFGYKKGFVSILGSYADEKIRSLAQEFLENSMLNDLQNTLYFPGFGARVLLDCNSRTEVLEKALAFRESRECKAFRAWLTEMNNATENGNLSFVIKSLNDIQSLLADLRKELGVRRFNGKAELAIGLSPSLTIGLETINPMLVQFKNKKLHLSFMRRHFHRALESSNIRVQIRRLFPELCV